jgi:hypothetical protein
MTFATACRLLVAAAVPAVAAGGEGPKRDDALRDELLRMVKEDQDARGVLIKAGFADPEAAKKMEAVDRRNTARLKEVVDKGGWPGKSRVGQDGAHAAWLLVQHADKDRAFQKRCLALLEKAVKAGEASGQDLAYLSDRVLVGEGKKQVYGTQFKGAGARIEPYPIEDETNVDRRRKEVGLPTMAEYRKLLDETYKSKPAEKK